RGVARDAEVLVVLEVPHGADRGVRRERRTAVGRQVAGAREARGVVDGRSSYGRAEGPGLEVLLHVRPAGATGEADVGRAAADELLEVDVVVGEGDRRRVGREVLDRLGQRGAAVAQGDLVGVRRRGLGAGVEVDAGGAAQGVGRGRLDG